MTQATTLVTVNYTRDGDDWTIMVSAAGKTLTQKAPGLIVARDRADQLVDKLAADESHRTVVHLLDGDAFAFTTAYLHARHGTPGRNATRSGGADQVPGDAGTGGTSAATGAKPEGSQAGNSGNSAAASAEELADKQ